MCVWETLGCVLGGVRYVVVAMPVGVTGSRLRNDRGVCLGWACEVGVWNGSLCLARRSEQLGSAGPPPPIWGWSNN